MKYLFDSNIFLKSKNEMPMDLWPTFWSCVKSLIERGDVLISIKVKEEIERGNDDLVHWLHETAKSYCQIDSAVLIKYAELQRWAASRPQYTTAALQEFANVADAYLVATAAAKGMTIVTYETSDPLCKRRVKIPDACKAIGVTCCDLNGAFRNLGVKI